MSLSPERPATSLVVKGSQAQRSELNSMVTREGVVSSGSYMSRLTSGGNTKMDRSDRN